MEAGAFTSSATIYDAIYTRFDVIAATDRLRSLIEHHHPTRASTLLDIACGTGLYLSHLRNYYNVEGIDLSSEMLRIAQQKLPEVPLHQGDLVEFDLNRQFDVVICLGSSIGYVRTIERLSQALATFARHTNPGGLVVVEPWFSPERWEDGRITMDSVDQSDLTIARILVSGRDDRNNNISTLDIHHLVACSIGIEHFVEHHELALFTHEEYIDSFRRANLTTHYDPTGLLGRGLYLGIKS